MVQEHISDRPKSLVPVPVKMPDELVKDIDYFRSLSKPIKSRGDHIKDCVEFCHIIKHGFRIGVYKLIEVEKNLY